MTNLHAQHSKGWSGLAFVVLLIAAIVIEGMPPAPNAGPAAATSYLTGHHQGLLVSAWLAFPLGAFFLWFVVGLSAFLRRASAEDEGLPTYVLVAGTFVTVAAWLGSAVMTAIIYEPSSGAASFMVTAQMFLQGPFLSMPLAIMIFAAAHSMRGMPPVRLGWSGWAT